MSQRPASLFELENRGHEILPGSRTFCDGKGWGRGCTKQNCQKYRAGFKGIAPLVPSVGFSLWPRDDWICTVALGGALLHLLFLPPLSSCLHTC